MGTEILKKEVLAQVKSLGTVELLVGIPSFNNAATVGDVARNFAKGLTTYYPEKRSLIINADGGSADGTRRKFLEPETPSQIKKLSVVYQGPSGKGSAFRTIFEIARLLDARVCVVTDADCRTNDPHWVDQLIRPVCEGLAGFVTPLYIRDKHDATITNGLIYPLTRALYGLDIRQPIGGDFAVSGGLLPVFTADAAWERFPDISTFGVDIWMTTTAIGEGVRIYQTSLGHKVHQPKEPGKDLLAMFQQVVGTTFALMGYYSPKWLPAKRSRPVPVFGEEPFGEIEDVAVDSSAMLDSFYEGYGEHHEFWKKILAPPNYEALTGVKKRAADSFLFPVNLWAKTVYDFAVYYHSECRNAEDRQELLRAMIPLYLGRTASYVRELQMISDELADAFVRGCAHVFERLKPYLVKHWHDRAVRKSGTC